MKTAIPTIPAVRFAKASLREAGLRVMKTNVRADGRGMQFVCGAAGGNIAEINFHLLARRKVQTDMYLAGPAKNQVFAERLSTTTPMKVKQSFDKRKLRLTKKGFEKEFLLSVYRSVMAVANEMEVPQD